MPKVSETAKKAKKRTRKGILGHPKRDKILFFVNRDVSDTSSDDSQDMNYDPNEDSQQSEAKRAKISSKKLKTSEDPKAKAANSTMNWSHNIPYELLLKIFLHYTGTISGNMNMLVILQNVCQYWKQVASDAQLWHSVSLSLSLQQPFKYSRVSNKMAEAKKFEKCLMKFMSSVYAGNKFQYLQHLDLSGLRHLTFENLEAVLSSCNSTVLTTLSVAYCKKIYVTKCEESVSFEKLIADNCSNLVSLDLTGMQKPLNLSSMKYLFTKLGSSLKDLNLSRNVMTASILAELSTSCLNLETINISNSEIKNNLDFSSFPKSLKTLHMLQTYPKTKFTSITSVLLSESNLDNLETLSTSTDSDTFSSTNHKLIIAKVFKDAMNLKNLDIRYYKSGLDRSVNLFSMVNSSRVERLYLSHANFTEVDQSYLADVIRNKWTSTLIELDLSWSNISSNYIQSIFDSFENSLSCKLKALNMTGTCVETNMIKQLVKHVASVESVNLNSCRSIDRGLKKVLDKDDLKQISDN